MSVMRCYEGRILNLTNQRISEVSTPHSFSVTGDWLEHPHWKAYYAIHQSVDSVIYEEQVFDAPGIISSKFFQGIYAAGQRI